MKSTVVAAGHNFCCFPKDLRMTEPYARLTELIDHHAKVIKEIN